MFHQETLTYFVRGSITVWLTSFLTGLESDVLLMFNQQHIWLFGQFQTSQIGGPPYSDTSPYKVSECYPIPHIYTQYFVWGLPILLSVKQELLLPVDGVQGVHPKRQKVPVPELRWKPCRKFSLKEVQDDDDDHQDPDWHLMFILMKFFVFFHEWVFNFAAFNFSTKPICGGNNTREKAGAF